MKLSPLDLMTALIRGGKLDPTNASADSGAGGSAADVAALILENRELVAILATSVAVLVGCFVVLVWRRSGAAAGKPKAVEPLKPLVVREAEADEDLGKKKVTVFFGTQTGTAEGFAKVSFFYF